VVSGEGRVIAFQPDKIVLGGGIGNMTLGQYNRWAPLIDELRTAAMANRKVRVYFDDHTRVVSAFVTRWSERCN
jgi:hypothetical protein